MTELSYLWFKANGHQAEIGAIQMRKGAARGDRCMSPGCGAEALTYAASTWATVGASPATVVRRMSRGWLSS
jgi:hypothetical protein